MNALKVVDVEDHDGIFDADVKVWLDEIGREDELGAAADLACGFVNLAIDDDVVVVLDRDLAGVQLAQVEFGLQIGVVLEQQALDAAHRAFEELLVQFGNAIDFLEVAVVEVEDDAGGRVDSLHAGSEPLDIHFRLGSDYLSLRGPRKRYNVNRERAKTVVINEDNFKTA